MTTDEEICIQIEKHIKELTGIATPEQLKGWQWTINYLRGRK